MNLYHITRRRDWERSIESGEYTGDAFEDEGFIHCSTGEQVVRVANVFYRNQDGLILLEIDPARLVPEVRWEASPEGELFPHLYGPLNREAVRKVFDFPPASDGMFLFPA